MNSDDLTPLKILAKIPHAFRSRTPLTMVEQIIYSCIWVVDLEEPWKTKVDYCRQELSKCFNIVKRLMTSGPKMMHKVLSSRSCCSDLEKLDQDHNIEEWRIQEPRPLRKHDSNYCVKCMAPIKSFIKRCMELIKSFIKICMVLIKSFIKTCLAPFTIVNSFLIKNLLPGELVGKIKSIKRRNMLAYKIMEKLLLKYEASCEDPFPLPGNATVLIAAKKGITEMVEGILRKNPEAIKCTRMTDSKNAMLVAIENRQADVYEFLTNLEKKGIEIPKWRYGGVTDHEGNNALHIAATKSSRQPWGMPTTLQLLWEIKWYNYVRDSMPPHFSQARNKEGKTPAEVFNETHEDQIKSLEGGGEWVNKTSQSCSVVASLIAAVTFAASTTFPGGNNNEGAANFLGKPAFSIFVISTFVALSLSLTSLIMFLTILISPYHNSDALGRSLPGKLIAGISALLGSIGATLISFWAAHMFYLQGKLKAVALPIYIAACLPFLFTVKAQIPFYTNLVLSVYKAKPRPWYRKFIT